MRGETIRIITILILLITLIVSGCLSTTSQGNYYDPHQFIESHEHFVGEVVKVVDGDTLWVRCKNGSLYKIRILGVDTPETYCKNNPYEYRTYDGTPITNTTYLKLWGYRAKEYVENMVKNKEVIVVFDRISPKRDRYNRYLAYIFVDGRDLGENLIINGYARVYHSQFELLDRYLEYEEYAKRHRIGLWNYSNT